MILVTICVLAVAVAGLSAWVAGYHTTCKGHRAARRLPPRTPPPPLGSDSYWIDKVHELYLAAPDMEVCELEAMLADAVAGKRPNSWGLANPSTNTPSGFITSDRPLSEDERSALLRQYCRTHTGLTKSHVPAVLNSLGFQVCENTPATSASALTAEVTRAEAVEATIEDMQRRLVASDAIPWAIFGPACYPRCNCSLEISDTPW